MLKTRNDDETRLENLKANLETYLGMRDPNKIVSQIEKDPEALSALFSSIGENLNPNDDIREEELVFYLNLIERLLHEFGVPIVGALEEEQFIQFLKMCIEKNLQEDVRSLVEACIQVVSFDEERETIPLIINFYIETFGKIPFPFFKNEGAFAQAFVCCMRIFRLERESRSAKGAEGIIKNLVNEALKFQKFYSTEFSPHENFFLKSCKQKLEDIKSELIKQEERAKLVKEEQKLYKEQVKALPKHELLKNRTEFYKDETLFFRESIEDEYKDYNFPISDNLERTLAKTICSFLNTIGGRIYMGITDNRIVKGMKVDSNTKVQIEETIKKILTWFEPEIANQNFVNLMYIPVLNEEKKRIPEYFVVKIIVKQGDPQKLYSASKEALECYIRYEGQSKFLNAKETTSEITSRYVTPGAKIPPEEFSDPSPGSEDFQINYRMEYTKAAEKQMTGQISEGKAQKLIEVKQNNNSFQNNSFQSIKSNSRGGNTSKKSMNESNINVNRKEYFDNIIQQTQKIIPIDLYQVFVEGLPSWTEDEFKEFLNSLQFESIVSDRMFKTDSGKCNGKAFVNFRDQNEALQFISSFNGSTFYGNTMKVLLKESSNKQPNEKNLSKK